MKNKMRIAVTAMLAIMVFVSGCAAKPTSSSGAESSENATEQYITMAKAKLNSATSFASDFYAEVKMDEEAEATISEAKVEMMKDPLAAGIVMEDSYGQKTQNSQLYLEKAENDVNMYMVYDGQWTEMTLGEQSAAKSVGIYNATKNMGLLLDAGQNWELTLLKNGIATVTGEVPASKVYEVVEAGAFLQLAGMTDVDESYYTDMQVVPFEIQIKEDGTPVSFSIDFAKTLEIVMNHVLQELGEGESDPIVAEKYLITQKISKLNEVEKIQIPAGAKNAINYEKEISLLKSSAANH